MISDTECVTYRVVESKKSADGREAVVYGIEGSDNNTTVGVLGLSYDLDRISILVNEMNRGQIPLGVLKNIVKNFLNELQI